MSILDKRQKLIIIEQLIWGKYGTDLFTKSPANNGFGNRSESLGERSNRNVKKTGFNFCHAIKCSNLT